MDGITRPRDLERLEQAAAHIGSACRSLVYAEAQPLRAPLLHELARVSLIHARGYLGAFGFESRGGGR